MTEDQRKKMVKVVHSMCEDARVSVRNLRREAIEKVKKAEKAKEFSEDDTERHEGTIQKLTDAYVKSIDDVGASKEKDLLTV